MLDILKKTLDAFAAGKWDACRAALDENVVYEEIGTRVRVEGAGRFIDVLKGWKRAFPDIKYTMRSSLGSGDRVMAEIEWEGTHDGPLEGPFGTIEATHKPGRVKAVILATFKSGKLVEERHYFDVLTILSNLGMTAKPQAGKPAEARPLH
jgi:steroid delta-isomerase-like uncharacterized protein